ncbi:MAG: hypothetical protein NTW48_03135 [Chloroflexi bacterium]|nr:hypothetical protein [Chloroflexota bacterium]
MNKITAIIILAGAIAVLIWDAFLLSRYKVSSGTVFAAFVVTALIGCVVSAFSGIEPFTSTKNEVMNWTQSLSTEVQDSSHETTTSPVSSFANVNGQVIIAEKLQALTAIPIPPNPNNNEEVFWIVKVTFKNLSYSNPIVIRWDKCYDGWVIIGRGEVYKPNCVGSITSDSSFNVGQGQSGEFTFNIIVPRSLTIDKAKICYQGQEPFSYGTLSGGEAVLAYDWESKSEIKHPFDDFIVAGKNMQLRTIASWNGSETTHIRFESNKSPWVVNWRYEKASEIGSKFDIFVITEAIYERLDVRDVPVAGLFGIFADVAWAPDKYGSIVVPQAGNFVIVVEASGLNWQVKVGVE